MDSSQIALILEYAKQYNNYSPSAVALGKTPIPKELCPYVATQLEVIHKNRKKIDDEILRGGFYFPSSLSFEQASSSKTANFKSHLVQHTDHLLDLSGGLGIDFLYMMQKAQWGWYNEIDPNLFMASKFNMPQHTKKELYFSQLDAIELLETTPIDKLPSLIYIDPYRRTSSGARAFSIYDCTPNLYEVYTLLKKKKYNGRLLAKLSPMLDSTQLLREFSFINKIYFLAVDRELKEILIEIKFNTFLKNEKETLILPKHINKGEIRFNESITPSKESILRQTISYSNPLKYIYEPNPALMKSTLWGLIASHYYLQKLNINAHLFTSENKISNFDGRIFEVLQVMEFSSKQLKILKKELHYACVISRASKLSAQTLSERLGLKEKKDCPFLISTLRADSSPCLILAKKISD